ncbi:MAG: MFS transporter [Alphaproteobacteria bacterium]|nr:MAG: MFS transporter [Alphaproteobacteria bacterium]
MDSKETNNNRPQNSEARQRLGTAALSLSMFLGALGTSIVNVGLPTFAKSFGAQFAEVQWLVLVYLLAVTALVVGAGRLGDLMGRRRVLMAGLTLFTVSSALCALAPNLWGMVVARGLQGTGAAAMMALTISFVGDLAPKGRTGRAMGMLGAMSAAGTAFGPTMGGFLLGAFEWPMLFWLNVPLGIGAILLAYRGLPSDGPRHGTGPVGFDMAGMSLLAAALCLYALAMTIGRTDGKPMNVDMLLLSMVFLILFLTVESMSASPLVRLGLLTDTQRGLALSANLVVSTVMMATLVIGPFYLTRVFALDTAMTGLVMSVGPVVAALAGTPSGKLVDRLGADQASRLALAGLLLAAGLLASMPEAWGLTGYVAAIMLLTANYALFQSANNTGFMAGAAVQDRGALSGLLGLSRNFGLITGASVMGALFSWATGTRDFASAMPDAVAHGMRASFAVAAALLFFMLGFSLLVWGRRARTTT